MTQDGFLAYIGVGSNMGDPSQNCREAVKRIAETTGIGLKGVSSFYRTEPVMISGEKAFADLFKQQQWYVNAVSEIRTTVSPRELLHKLQDIEKTMGRVRTIKGASRVIDLDILLYDQKVLHEPDLMIPHPEMHKRLFVLEPLCEIASYAIHPVFGISVRGLKDRLKDSAKVEKI